jgi:hypothetical protein
MSSLHECEISSLTSKEEHKVRGFGSGVLRRIFGPKRVEVSGPGENCIMKSCSVSTFNQILLTLLHQCKCVGTGM